MPALAGARVLVTRAAEERDPLLALLTARGAHPLPMPVIAFADPGDGAALAAALDLLVREPPAAMAIASPTAARRLFEALRARGVDPLSVLPPGAVVVAGPGTARALDALGFPGALLPEGIGAAAMAEALLACVPPGARVSVPRAEGGSRLVEERLRAAGADVRAFVLYRTVPVVSGAPGVSEGLAALRTGGVDAIALGSGSAARALATLLGPEAITLCARPVVACMGEPTAREARAAGLRVDAVADGDFSRLVDALEQALLARRR